jgi:MFS family permease
MLFILSIGYMIDFYDLTILAATREAVLTSLGVPPEDIMSTSAWMFNIQALGIFLGGIISGVWGDKIGRMSAVRWGIFLYSTATLLNLLTTSIEWFAFYRFLAGVGLAGELAASMTYLSEMSKAEDRGYIGGTVYFFGVLGGIIATVIASQFDWQVVYFVGGIAGYILLLVRLTYADSRMFNEIKANNTIRRGDLKWIFTNASMLKRMGILGLAIIPFWFMVYFVNFAPEIAREMGFENNINQHLALICYFIGSLIGSYLFPILAQQFGSRKKAIQCAFLIMISSIALLGGLSFIPWSYYVVLLMLGVACGYPGLYMMMVAETFGTNHRSTGAGIIATCARTSMILINIIVPWVAASCGNFWTGALLCAGVLFMLTMVSFRQIGETHNRAMDFCEE